jgi:nitroimidazol reductase NimA-like FMN-containing flavoprotein (pyridoxamine 5'-phosphate oxidase superfamily)
MIDPTVVARSSAWTPDAIADFLVQTVVPCRLSCITSGGYPHVNSLWYLYGDGALWLSTQNSSAVWRWLRADPRCGFEVAGDQPPYRGVRGRGHVTLLTAREAPVLARLLERYLSGTDSPLARWLLSRAANEATLRIEPHWLTAWDYAARMAPVVPRGSG